MQMHQSPPPLFRLLALFVENLHVQIFEMKKEHQQTVDLLQQKIAALKKTLQQQQDTMMDKDKETTQTIDKLSQEREDLSSRGRQVEEALAR